MIAPHGGRLVHLVADETERGEWQRRLPELPRLPVIGPALAELENIATGLYSPLDGFMAEESYRSVVDGMRLPDGTVWPIPIVLPIDPGDAERVGKGDPAALTDRNGRLCGVIEVRDIFERDVPREAEAVYGTGDPAHPGVSRLLAEPRTVVGGRVHLIERSSSSDGFADVRFDPAETRVAFEERGWKTIVAFQTRNPIHRAHEYLQKCALEMVDGLFINPLVGETKADDTPADVRLACYRALIEGYFPRDRVFLGVFPAPMRYAGPREAVFHAICRQNYGCTHIIIGRDHAGVGDYYGTYDAQRIFDRLEPGDLAITPIKFEHAFFCRVCGQMASAKTCPHGAEERLFLSGTRVREMLRRGETLPPEFTRPEVARILANAMEPSA